MNQLPDIRQYANLASAQGVQFSVGYVVQVTGLEFVSEYKAWGVDFSVQGHSPAIYPESHVEVVLINRAYFDGMYRDEQVWVEKLESTDTYETLSAFGGSVMGTVNVLTFAESQPRPISYIPQIAVVIDGVWQQDPMQWVGAHNFNFAWMIPQ